MLSSISGVLILYNRPGASVQGSFSESEAGVLDEVAAVAHACAKLHLPCRQVGVEALCQIPDVLAVSDENIVFNLVEEFREHPEHATWVPALCAAFGKACTGNGTAGLILSLDKWQSKAVLQGAGVPCPKALCLRPDHVIRDKDLFPGPYMVKPVGTDASEGIDRDSVIANPGQALNLRVAHLHKTFGRPVLVEQYIDGRELNVSVLWRHGEPQVLPLAEIDFSAFEANRPRIVGYEAKWLEDSFEFHHTPRVIPAPLPEQVESRVRALAIAACRALGCQDYCRVDFRLDASLSPYVLEVNANPDISPDAGFAAALQARDIGYHEFIRLALNNALSRLARKTAIETLPPASLLDRGTATIRWCQSEDRDMVLAFLARTHMFRPNELQIAREVLDDGIKGGPQGHYQSWVACCGSQVTGWVAYGPTPCTLGTWDLYWIGVDPDQQGQGIGKQLMAFAEEQIQSHGGQRVVVETSGRDIYKSTVSFYERIGYSVAANIPDFYDMADPKIVLTKTLTDSI